MLFLVSNLQCENTEGNNTTMVINDNTFSNFSLKTKQGFKIMQSKETKDVV